MSDRPTIGIVLQTQETSSAHSVPCWITGQRYIRALVTAGAIPWLIPLLPDDESALRLIYQRLDAVFLTGGVDVDPSHYGEARHKLCDRADPARDCTEITLIRWALADHKPIFGVCRGIQIINVACGGSLYQHLADRLPEGIKHDYFSNGNQYRRDYLAHSVRLVRETRLGRLLEGASLQVNSLHHQGIKTLGNGLRPCAFAPDGLIEGVESNNGTYLVGVQWHPEELADIHAPHRRLFTDFIAAAARFRSQTAAFPI